MNKSDIADKLRKIKEELRDSLWLLESELIDNYRTLDCEDCHVLENLESIKAVYEKISEIDALIMDIEYREASNSSSGDNYSRMLI